MKMNFMLWITLFVSVFTVSLGQIPVESCISYNASESPMLNIKWDNENVDLLNNVFIVLYQTEESDVFAGENCIEGNNRTNINIVQGIGYVTEVRTTLRDTCNPEVPNAFLQSGSSTAEHGYISNLDSNLSDGNSTITFTCHLACQTDFITGCNITLVDACGRDFIQSCTVNNTESFSPRQCSVVFRDLSPSSYDYTATVQSNRLLQVEENVLNMTGTFVTADDNNFSCESDEIDNNATTNSPVPNENSTTTNSDTTMNGPVPTTNTNNNITTSTPTPDENTTNANSDSDTSETPTNSTANNDDDSDDTTDIPSGDNDDDTSSNNGTANSQDDDDDTILDRIQSLPVPVLASIGAVILIMIIVVILLLILFCRMKKSNKNDKSKESGPRSSPAVCDSFTFQNSTTALFGSQADSCSDTKSDVHTLSEPFDGNVSKSSSYDHLAKSFKPKQPTPPISHQSSYRSQYTDNSSTRNSDVNKIPQSYESSVATRDEELLDDFDYDEIEDTPTTHTRTQYNNLVHSGKEHRLKIECPPAPTTTGTYERLSQPPSEDNYAVPPELDDADFQLKFNHDYDQVPPELSLSGRNSVNVPADATYDRLSPKTDNTYDQVAKEFQYDIPANNNAAISASNSQYDTLLPKPKPPVLENQSTIGLHSHMTKRQPSPVRVQHNPGPVTGDMYTVPKKFEIKSSKSSHDYDTVVDKFESQSTMF